MRAAGVLEAVGDDVGERQVVAVVVVGSVDCLGAFKEGDGLGDFVRSGCRLRRGCGWRRSCAGSRSAAFLNSASAEIGFAEAHVAGGQVGAGGGVGSGFRRTAFWRWGLALTSWDCAE